MDTLNKWLLWLLMLQLNVHQKSVLFENLASLPFCSTFIRTVTKHNQTHWHWHSVNKQKNNERYSQLVFFQCSHKKLFYFYIVQYFHYFVHPLYVYFALYMTEFCQQRKCFHLTIHCLISLVTTQLQRIRHVTMFMQNNLYFYMCNFMTVISWAIKGNPEWFHSHLDVFRDKYQSVTCLLLSITTLTCLLLSSPTLFFPI